MQNPGAGQRHRRQQRQRTASRGRGEDQRQHQGAQLDAKRVDASLNAQPAYTYARGGGGEEQRKQSIEPIGRPSMAASVSSFMTLSLPSDIQDFFLDSGSGSADLGLVPSGLESGASLLDPGRSYRNEERSLESGRGRERGSGGTGEQTVYQRRSKSSKVSSSVPAPAPGHVAAGVATSTAEMRLMLPAGNGVPSKRLSSLSPLRGDVKGDVNNEASVAPVKGERRGRKSLIPVAVDEVSKKELHHLVPSGVQDVEPRLKKKTSNYFPASMPNMQPEQSRKLATPSPPPSSSRDGAKSSQLEDPMSFRMALHPPSTLSSTESVHPEIKSESPEPAFRHSVSATTSPSSRSSPPLLRPTSSTPSPVSSPSYSTLPPPSTPHPPHLLKHAQTDSFLVVNHHDQELPAPHRMKRRSNLSLSIDTRLTDGSIKSGEASLSLSRSGDGSVSEDAFFGSARRADRPPSSLGASPDNSRRVERPPSSQRGSPDYSRRPERPPSSQRGSPDISRRPERPPSSQRTSPEKGLRAQAVEPVGSTPVVENFKSYVASGTSFVRDQPPSIPPSTPPFPPSTIPPQNTPAKFQHYQQHEEPIVVNVAEFQALRGNRRSQQPPHPAPNQYQIPQQAPHRVVNSGAGASDLEKSIARKILERNAAEGGVSRKMSKGSVKFAEGVKRGATTRNDSSDTQDSVNGSLNGTSGVGAWFSNLGKRDRGSDSGSDKRDSFASPTTSIQSTIEFPRDIPISDFEETLVLEREAFGMDPDTFYTSIYKEDEDFEKRDAGEAARRLISDEDSFGGRVLTRRHGRTLVHFLYKECLDLFDEVVGFKESNPHVDRNAAHERFSGRNHGDAVIKVAYADNETHWDAILKYNIESEIAGEDTAATVLNEEHQNHFETSADAIAAVSRLRHNNQPTHSYNSLGRRPRSKKRDEETGNFEDEEEIEVDERITEMREMRAHYERELMRHHLILVRERGVDVDVKIGRNVTKRIHYVKIMASFDTLCLEAERSKLKLEVS
ncbi:hypothetical protein HDU97_006622, partial [Phlyctochytrium planicorne]